MKVLKIILMGLLTIGPLSGVASQQFFASGEKQLQLIELYTSQGCSSCVPAEQWMSHLRQSPRLWKQIVPLAFHVDYWNYLGWRDPYASGDFSNRQHQYHQQGVSSAVYTPGFVINGREWRGFFKNHQLPDSDVRHPGQLLASLSDNHLQVTFQSPPDKLTLNLAILGFGSKTPVTDGENKGRTLLNDFVVLVHKTYPSITNQWAFSLPKIKPHEFNRFALALWVNRQDTLKPLQAVGGWLDDQTAARLLLRQSASSDVLIQAKQPALKSVAGIKTPAGQDK